MKLMITVLSLVTAISSMAQTNVSFPVKGTIGIKYNSRSAVGTPGVKDIYTMQVNVANSALFKGTIQDQPQIISGLISKTVTQPRKLTYDVSLDVVNPKNPSQTMNVGKMIGNVPITSDGTYNYDSGSLEVSVLPIRNAPGFTSKFGGKAQGKPLGRPSNFLDTLQRETVKITRSINGKTTTISLKKYDKMVFQQHVVGAGPVQSYPSVTFNGEMLYDYDKSCWFLNNLTMQYADGQTIRIDRLSGTIRWVELSKEYQFDVRVNEKLPSNEDVFSSKEAADESSFFEVDNSVSALIGTMKYKDEVKNGVTMSSDVIIDLTGNNISKQQTMALTKAIIFSAVVPMNAD
jgi:hypothetical protein